MYVCLADESGSNWDLQYVPNSTFSVVLFIINDIISTNILNKFPICDSYQDDIRVI